MKILFICTGNTCRSPMAEGIFKKISENDDTISCSSAGISLCDGEPVSKNSVIACKDIGIDISDHTAQSIKPDDIENYDIFAVMTANHAQTLLTAGIPKEKIYIMGNGISDPFGGDIEIYRKCCNEIKTECEKLYKIITSK